MTAASPCHNAPAMEPDRVPSLLVLGDSVAMPRASAGQRLDEAWPQLLDASGAASVRWVRSVGAATAYEVLAEVRHLASYIGERRTWDAVAIQVGIVDCSPRPFPRRLQKLLDLVPGLRPRINRRLPLLLRFRARPWVSEADFERLLDTISAETLRYCGRVLLIEVIPPGPGLVGKLGSFEGTVARYNAALQRVAARRPGQVAVVRGVAPERLSEALLPDGHHLTAAGHRSVADALQIALRDGPAS
jgi:GDSL-like lipase/acylhydrolase family protein